VSVTLHLLLLVLALVLPKIETPQDETPFQVELLDQENRNSIIMAPSDLEDRMDDVKRKATAMSDKRRRVELETRKAPQKAQLRAPLKSRSQVPTPQQKPQQAQDQKRERRFDDKTLFEDPSGVAFQKNEDRKPLFLPMGARRAIPQPHVPSYLTESLPEGLEIGNVSALNTDQHLFYNFNSRLIGGFAPLWVQYVGQTVHQWMTNNSFPKVAKTWVTNVEVVMSPDGEILEIQHYRLSGLWPFDEAPIKAFKRLKHVPNPPQEMIGDDGYIRLKFQTEVHWSPSPSGGFGLSRGN